MQWENRKARVGKILSDLSSFRCCAASDELEEHWGNILNYKELLIHLKTLSRGLIPSELFEQVESIPQDFQSIYELYDAKARLDAILPDIGIALDSSVSPLGEPAPQYCLVSRNLIDSLQGLSHRASIPQSL